MPLRIVLREFARERSRRGAGYAVEDYLHDHYRARGQNFPPQFFCHFIERGQCALLFDGMDEVGTAAQRIEMRDLIENLARAHPANRFIVTSRPTGYEAAPLDRREFYAFSILDFDDDAIRQFIENWYRAVEGKNEPEAKEGARLLSESLDANPNVKRLAVNPLMLTIIATIHRTERLPNQRVRLYDKCTESLLVKWDEVRGVGSAPIGEEEQRRRLEHIAYWMHSENIGDVERDELQRKLTRFLKSRPDAADEASRFIDRLVERAGILVERSPDRFAFVHRTFQEYFAAMDIYNRYLDEEDPQIVHDAVMTHLHDPRWEEVSLLTMAKLKVKPATKLLQAILSANSWGEDVLHRDLFFAARVLADDVMVERAVAERVVKELCDGLLNTHGRENLHGDYLKILMRIVRSEHGTIATAVLRDSHERFLDAGCTDWITPLAARREPETAQLLLNLARKADDEWVQWRAAVALGKLGEKAQVVPLLLDLARTARDETVRRLAAWVLGLLGEKAQAAQLLLNLARTANDEYVRGYAAWSLGRLGEKNEGIVTGLLELAHITDSEAVRQHATTALGELGERNEVVISGLLELARTASSQVVRHLAADALGELGEKSQAAQLLLDLARTASAENVQSSAAWSVGRLGEKNEVIITGLLELARTASSEWVRQSAAQALGELGEKAQAIPLLLDLARTASGEKVRLDAAESLGKLSEKEQAAQLLLNQARTANNEWMRQRAAQSLGELGEQVQATPLLLDLARAASDEKVRQHAAEALGKLGEKTQSVLDGLLDLARQDESAEVRDAQYGALKALVSTNEEQ